MSSLWALAGTQPAGPEGCAVCAGRRRRILRDLKSTDDIFAAIRKQDILLHHPYDSFGPVLDFIKRRGRRSRRAGDQADPLPGGAQRARSCASLLEAQRNGKQVAVLVELKARFDEESNIGWARALEAEGVHVVYGLVGLKTHSKITLVVRSEPGGLRRYLHLATGNYNAVTAGIYTDLGLLTCDPEMGADATELFNTLTGYSTAAVLPQPAGGAGEHARADRGR